MLNVVTHVGSHTLRLFLLGLLFATITSMAVSPAVAQILMPTPIPPQPTDGVPWGNLGGTANASIRPAVTDRIAITNSVKQDYFDVYAVSSSGSTQVDSESYVCRKIGTRYDCGISFTGWVDLGFATTMSPSAVGWGTHREVFVVGADNNLYHNATDNTSWTGWESLAAPPDGVCSAPSAVSWAAGRIDVFVRGCQTPNNIWHIWFNGSWQSWEVPAGSPSSQGTPGAIAPSTGVIEVMAAGTNNIVSGFVCHDGNCNNGSNSWQAESAGILACSNPPVVAAPSPSSAGSPDYQYSVISPCGSFARELQGILYSNGWQTVESFPALLSQNQISAGSSARVFFRDALGYIEYGQFSTAWAKGYTVGTSFFAGDPASVTGIQGDWVVATQSDGSIWYAYVTN